MVEGVRVEGVACLQCDYFAVQDFSRCPVCGGVAERTDVVDYAAEKSLLAGGYVETVYGEARDSLMKEGGVGAVLRY